MGTGAEFWVPALIAAVGTGAQVYTTRETAKDQDQAAARGIRNQQAKQREIDSRVDESIGALERSGPEEERAASLDQYLAQLRSARSQSNGGDVPVTGGRYEQDMETSRAAIGNYGEKVAGLLSRIRAASDQRTNEGYEVGRMGSDISGTARNASGQAFIDQLRTRGITPNLWVNAGGEILKGIGGAMATRTPQGPAPGGVPPSGPPDPWAGQVPQANRRFG